MTILTADYEDGVKWILENKKGRNVFSILSSNLGNFTDEGIKEFMLWLKVYLRKGDMLIVGLDMKKDPFLIQQAYSNA